MDVEDNYNSSPVNEAAGNNANVVAVGKEKRKKRPWSSKTRNKIPTKCDVCKADFKLSSSLISQRRIHFELFDYHCRTCLVGFFQKFDRNKHEEKCKKRRYECYICHYIGASSAVIEKHLRTHTDMTSFPISKALRKGLAKRNAKARKIGKEYVAKKRATIKMENMETMDKMQTQVIGVIDLTDD